MVTDPAPPPSSPKSPRPASARRPRRGEHLQADRVVAAGVALALTPVLAARAAAAWWAAGRVFDEHPRLGKDFRPIVIKSFAGAAPGRRLAYLASVIEGDVRFIGPRPLHPDDEEAISRRDPQLTPGLLSPGRLRARTGIDYEAESQAEAPVLSRKGVGLAARYGIAEVLGDQHLPSPPTFTLLGITITNTGMEEALDWCVDEARSRPASMLAFVNAACFNEKVENPAYAAALDLAERVLPDGIGAKLGARLRGVSLVANVNGTDMFPRLCERAAQADLGLFLLGARPGIAEAVARAMTERFPTLRITGTQHGYFAAAEEARVVERINASHTDILLVAFGVPRQEIWLAENRHRLDVGLVQGVGGLFDFYSGYIPRAPIWLREIGLEWAWRLAQEPSRMWRRYVVGNPKFLARAGADARRGPAPPAPDDAARPLLNYRDVYPEDD